MAEVCERTREGSSKPQSCRDGVGRTQQRRCPTAISVSARVTSTIPGGRIPVEALLHVGCCPGAVCFCPSGRSPVPGAAVPQRHQVHGRVEAEVCHQVAKSATLTAQPPLGTCCWVGKGCFEVGAACSCLPAVRTSPSSALPARRAARTHTQPICTTGAQETCSVHSCDLILQKNLLAGNPVDVETVFLLGNPRRSVGGARGSVVPGAVCQQALCTQHQWLGSCTNRAGHPTARAGKIAAEVFGGAARTVSPGCR